MPARPAGCTAPKRAPNRPAPPRAEIVAGNGGNCRGIRSRFGQRCATRFGSSLSNPGELTCTPHVLFRVIDPDGTQPRQGRHSLARGVSPWKTRTNAQAPEGRQTATDGVGSVNPLGGTQKVHIIAR